jgi:hypothetical protein
MKKLIVLFLILCMACMLISAGAEEDITGEWTLYQMGIGGVMFDAKTLGMNIVMNIRADGTMEQKGEIQGQNMDGSGTWTLEGNELTISMGKTPKIYTFADGKLTVEKDGQEAVFVKETPAPKDEKAEKPKTVAAGKEDDFFGSWRLEWIEVAGITLTKEMLPSLGVSENYDSVVTIEAGRITSVTDAGDGNGPQTMTGTTRFEDGKLMITYELPEDLEKIAKEYGLDKATAEMLEDGNLCYRTTMMGIDADMYMVRTDAVTEGKAPAITAPDNGREEIRFLGIPWGSDMDTVCRALQETGWINEDGVERFEQTKKMLEKGFGRGREYNYIHFGEEDGYPIVDREDESANVEEVTLMSDMVTETWMGVEVHNIGLVFALDGDTEKLVMAEVSLMVNRENLQPQMEELLGAPDRAEEDYYALWTGEHQTAVLYTQTDVTFGLLNAKEIVDSSERIYEEPTRRPGLTEQPTPEPTEKPEVTGKDLLDYLGKGEKTFLGIPWDSEAEETVDVMIGQELISEEVRQKLNDYVSEYGLVLSNAEDHWEMNFVDKGEYGMLFFNTGDITGKTFCGYPLQWLTLTFKQEDGKMRFKNANMYLEVTDGNAARADLKPKMDSVLGEGAEWYGSFFWNGDNGTVVELGGTDTTCNILYGVNVPQQ